MEIIFGRIAIISTGCNEIYASLSGELIFKLYQDEENIWNCELIEEGIHEIHGKKSTCVRSALMKFTRKQIDLLRSSSSLKEAIANNHCEKSKWLMKSSINLIYKEGAFKYLYEHYPWQCVGASFILKNGEIVYIKGDGITY
jgi:hypothetical protein